MPQIRAMQWPLKNWQQPFLHYISDNIQALIERPVAIHQLSDKIFRLKKKWDKFPTNSGTNILRRQTDTVD